MDQGSGRDESEQGVALLRMLDAAQRFLDCHDLARAQSPWAEPPAPLSLAAAIDRDFTAFDLERAKTEFRAALAALSGSLPAPAGAGGASPT